jgi:endoglucanase Acf2
VSGRARAAVVGLALAASVTGCAGSAGDRGSALPDVDPASVIKLGAGRYSRLPFANEKLPSNAQGKPVAPKVTASWKGVPTSNDWWSSLIWQFDRDGKPNPYSEPLFAHPLTLQARAAGLGLGGAGKPDVGPRSYFYPYHEDLVVGVEGLAAPATKVARYDDWTVTARWENAVGAGPGARSLDATFGHGLPFVYLEAAGGAAVVRLPAGEQTRIFAETPGTVGVTVEGRAYGVFAPRGVAWSRQGQVLRADLGAHGYFSVALLPDDKPETLARFRRHAFAFVTGTRVSWQYDPAAGTLTTKFALTTEARDSAPGKAKGKTRDADDVPLVALYPHQWKHLGRELPGPSYVSPRGPMKLLAAQSFEIALPFAGVLPVLPDPTAAGAGGDDAEFDRDELASMVRAAARADDLFPPGLDGTKGSYWTGKSLERVALLAWLADQVGESEARATLVSAIRGVLEDWFNGHAPNLFAYDETWATLIGVPSEYRSGWELNDHHFHYGQFIFAAATVARFDRPWAADTRYGRMVDLLIRDCANADRSDHRFPFLRHFDPYAGHSWANGPSLFAEGNNEESSSEDMNFASAVTLWGALTGKRETRDLGVFLQANLATAIEQYWFDVDGENFPEGFDKPAVGMVWGAGGKYDTWWDRNPIYVHGINFLPFTGGSLHLGRRADYVRRNYDALVKANRGEPRLWREIIWMYLALVDPAKALAQYRENPHFQPEFGVSRPFVYQWLHALARYGRVDPTVTADTPTFAVFRAGATRHHVAMNPGPSALRVHFSDGVVVELPAYGEKTVSKPIAPATAAR